jgi:hypothetical protein
MLRCDFCGREVPRVRRVALEAGYDRLTRRHAVRYACPECSERKSAERSRAQQPAAVDDPPKGP